MERRQFLATIGSGSGLFCAGCIDGAGGANGSSDQPEGMKTATLYTQADVLTEAFSDRESPYFDWQEEDHTLISDVAAAEEGIISDEEIDTFIEKTDFTESYLLIVRNGMQSQMELVLDEIERKTDGLDVAISIEGPEQPDDDLVTHSLLIRITDEREEIPDKIDVTIEGYV